MFVGFEREGVGGGVGGELSVSWWWAGGMGRGWRLICYVLWYLGSLSEDSLGVCLCCK